MNKEQGRLSGKVALIAVALGVVFLTMLSPSKVYADPIAITDGFYTFSSPFRTSSPVYNNFTSDLRGNNFRAFTHVTDEISLQLGSNCDYPCVAGSTFRLSGARPIAQFSPTGFLEINGERRFGFFFGSTSQFETGTVTIPLDAGSELTLSTNFMMTGVVGFAEYDLQRLVFTGYTFNSEIFGSGIVDIALFLSQTTGQYEVSAVRYNFQPQPVPEPATLLLLLTGLGGMTAKGYKRRKSIKSRMIAGR
ncbi:MAG: hypothetical protein QOE77_2606 [Blastocatellia bacterium]|jgi:hypothetical protein|nr:hypothetical protein [Blastocatellia bacterium]